MADKSTKSVKERILAEFCDQDACDGREAHVTHKQHADIVWRAVQEHFCVLLGRLESYADDADATVDERTVAATTHSVLSELLGLKSKVLLP